MLNKDQKYYTPLFILEEDQVSPILFRNYMSITTRATSAASKTVNSLKSIRSPKS